MVKLKNSFYDEVYSLVKKIPKSKVLTYGRIATMLNRPKSARIVGYAMHALAGESFPWHRVVPASATFNTTFGEKQVELLKKEGVIIRNKKDIEKYIWRV